MEPRQLLHGLGDPILDWNEAALDALRADRTQPGPVRAARNLAIVHAAMFDAVNGTTGEHEYFFVRRPAPAGASADAAAAQAAFTTLRTLYPRQRPALRAEFDASLAELPATVETRRGLKYGKLVAGRILSWRAFDGAEFEGFFSPGDRPGDWRPTAPDFRRALHPDAGFITPFAVEGARQFLPPAPPELFTQEYADAYAEVYELGAVDSATRTADQTQVADFWAYDRDGLGTPVALYNQVLQAVAIQEGNTVAENARLFALANVAMADAGITAWEAKYTDAFWRPVTGIREGDFDGNAATVGDRSWEPLGAPNGDGEPFTPPHPAHVSAHSTLGAACFRTLLNFYATDDLPFTLTSDEVPGVTRTYSTFSQAAQENGDSRIYLGVNWRFADTFGQETGRQVADYVYDHYMLPVV